MSNKEMYLQEIESLREHIQFNPEIIGIAIREWTYAKRAGLSGWAWSVSMGDSNLTVQEAEEVLDELEAYIRNDEIGLDKCIWTVEEIGGFATECGFLGSHTDGECPYCGKPIWVKEESS